VFFLQTRAFGPPARSGWSGKILLSKNPQRKRSEWNTARGTAIWKSAIMAQRLCSRREISRHAKIKPAKCVSGQGSARAAVPLRRFATAGSDVFLGSTTPQIPHALDFVSILESKIPSPERVVEFPCAVAPAPASTETRCESGFGGPLSRLGSKPCIRHSDLCDGAGCLSPTRTKVGLFLSTTMTLINSQNSNCEIWNSGKTGQPMND
jgi:hypothetical protein